ncbi:MAG: penicillin-binding transpeptidase domain-containing protein, partial [Firmicutes bacterium]|nr:penicillin-binding transpeptidase domain-containing protein [Bacillota bacterium]
MSKKRSLQGINQREEEKAINVRAVRRALAYSVTLTAIFGAIGWKFWSLQIDHGQHFHALARQDVLRTVNMPAQRGKIVSSNGQVVATSKPSWTVFYVASGQMMPAKEVALLAAQLGVSASSLTQTIKTALPKVPSYQPISLMTNLSPAQITRLDQHKKQLPHVLIQPVAVPYFPFGSMMGNIIGYLGPVTSKQYQQLKSQGYPMDAVIGQAGLEEEYQKYLRGHSGGEQAEVNREGHVTKIVHHAGGSPGDTVHLTINWRLEETAQKSLNFVLKSMRDSKVPFSHSSGAIQGAVIAIDPNNGDILAMASDPTYNPNKLLPQNPLERSTYYHHLMDTTAVKKDHVNPFTIVPIQGWFAPGSVFKPIMAVAALASGVVTPHTKIFDPGYFLKDRSFGNWYPPGFGWLNIEMALGLSDDVFFYHVGYDMGIQTMDKWMRRFQLNQKTGIDLPGEWRSEIPTPARLKADGLGQWTWGWNLNTVIGQGIARYTL